MGGKVSKGIGNVVGTGLTLGLNKVGGGDNPFRRMGDFIGSVATGGTSGQGWGARRNDVNGNPIDGDGPAPVASDPFVFDPYAAAADRSEIEAEGTRQYDETNKAIDTYGTAATQRAHDLFGQMLPDIAENSQAAHLYDSTGYGNEVARQQSQIASAIAEQEAQQRMAALGVRQGFQTGGVQRVMSLEDFANQAKVAKSIGATVAPQAPNSKATALQGGVAGAGAGASFGPYGAILGGAGGALLGSQASNNPKQGK